MREAGALSYERQATGAAVTALPAHPTGGADTAKFRWRHGGQVQPTRQCLTGMISPPEHFACEASRLRRRLMLEEKQRLDAPTSCALSEKNTLEQIAVCGALRA